jgi:hypothetical protein
LSVDAGRSEHRIEGGREFAVAIPDQKAEPAGVVIEVHQQIPGGLGHPFAGRVGGDPGQVHPCGVPKPCHRG